MRCEQENGEGSAVLLEMLERTLTPRVHCEKKGRAPMQTDVLETKKSAEAVEVRRVVVRRWGKRFEVRIFFSFFFSSFLFFWCYCVWCVLLLACLFDSKTTTVGLYVLGKEKQKKQIYERYKTNTLLFETYILSASLVLEKKKATTAATADEEKKSRSLRLPSPKNSACASPMKFQTSSSAARKPSANSHFHQVQGACNILSTRAFDRKK